MRQLERRVRLAHPTTHGKYTLYTDASGEAVGAVLVQRQGQRTVPVAFHSRVLNGAEAAYSPTELEALAVIDGLKKFRYYLHGPAQFDIVTDHAALVHVRVGSDRSPH